MMSPITSLWGNIIHTFENIDKSSINMHLRNIKIRNFSPFINYDNTKQSVKTPKVDLVKKEISIHETYLEHLWSFIYSVFVLFEEGIQKPLINNSFRGEVDFSLPLLQRAWDLFGWSTSLSTNYSNWDLSLPNPIVHKNDTEKLFAEKTNALFQKSTAYVLYHEYAHLDLNHKPFFFGTKISNSSEEFSQIIELEKEADLYAFEMIIKEDDRDLDKLILGISILMVFLSSVFLIEKPMQLKQEKHPDIDQRILNILLKLDFKSKESQFYSWYLCVFIMRLFFMKHNLETKIRYFDTDYDAFSYYLNRIDQIKTDKGSRVFNSREGS